MQFVSHTIKMYVWGHEGTDALTDVCNYFICCRWRQGQEWQVRRPFWRLEWPGRDPSLPPAAAAAQWPLHHCSLRPCSKIHAAHEAHVPLQPGAGGLLNSDWSKVITWAGYWPLIGGLLNTGNRKLSVISEKTVTWKNWIWILNFECHYIQIF